MARPKNNVKKLEESVYEAEKLVGIKETSAGTHFFVKWKGYPSSENTWEPIENLNCPKLLENCCWMSEMFWRGSPVGLGSDPFFSSMLRTTFPSNVREYVLLRPLGKGSFGEVYEAAVINDSQNLRFAIKMIEKKKIARIPGMSQRVQNEITIHSQLRHPNILRLHYHFEDKSRVYLVMELCQNGELYQYLRGLESRCMSEMDIKPLFRAIVSGVDYLHEHGIIHRDLKLSNILLGNDMKPKLADFGLAVRPADPNSCEQQTLCGTPNYLAPEILLKRPYGAAADQWSLGCILYSLLTGRPPFENDDGVRETFERVSKTQFTLPSGLSFEARDLISRLIVHDPLSRLNTRDILDHPFLNTTGQDQKPISTVRLRPLKQQTKHGIFQLLPSGFLWVDLMADPTVTLISPDGSSIWSLPKGTVAPSSDDDIKKVKSNIECHSFLSLSPVKRRVYEYARKFVDLMRSKTPRVVICTCRLRAFLMDNGSLPDMLIRFYADEKLSGWRLEFSSLRQSVKIFDPTGRSHRELSRPSQNSLKDSNLDHSSRLIISEFLARYEQALTTANCVKKDQDLGYLPYPFVVREQVNSSETVCPPTIPMLTLSGETSIDSHRLPFYQSKSIPRLPNDCASFGRAFEIAYKTYLPHVGWCLASKDDQYLMLFTSGSSVILDGRANRMAFQDTGQPLTWYMIDDQLPKRAKICLSHFPRFVALLKQSELCI